MATVSADVRWGAVPLWLLESDVSSHAIRIFALLHGRWADKENQAWPSRKTIADLIHASVDTVDRAIEQLVDAGAVTVEHRDDDQGDPTSNRYTLRFLPLGSRTLAPTSSRTLAARVGAPVPTKPDPSNQTQLEGVRPTVPSAYGKDAQAGVVAYVEARRLAGLPVDRSECGKLARHLIAARKRGWSQEMCLRAVSEFAASKRAVVFFGEWCATVFNAESAAEHEQRREEELRDGPMAPSVLASLMPMRKMA